MKAQKAAVICTLAGCFAYQISALTALPAAAVAEEEPDAVFSAETVAADMDGHFTAAVSLAKLPETGLCAAEFAIAYDAAALTITDVTLLYDTGAQKAEDRIHPDFSGTVFSYELRDGLLWVRWATALLDASYWLREERPLLAVSGVLSDSVPTGIGTELRIVPAEGGTAEAEITAGYLDAENTAHYCKTAAQNGAVWRAIDETGATMYGDIDLDGQLAVADAVMLHRVIAEELALSAAAYANADCEFDGLLTLGDVTLILRYLNQTAGDTALGAH